MPQRPCVCYLRGGVSTVSLRQVPGTFYVNDALKALVFEELEHASGAGGVGGFLPAVKQIGNVAALPGIVKVCVGAVG